MASLRQIMRPRIMRPVSALLFVASVSSACTVTQQPPVAPRTHVAAERQRVNLAHFDHLFAEAKVGGEQVGVLRIYSEAPDYSFAIEPNEGYACVDDVARGMVLLAAMPTLNPARMRQLDLMTRFVIRLQADNGYFHNFIWAGGRINREYRTSLAELNWWSLRALWGLEAAVQKLPKDSDIARRARAAADRLVVNLKRDLPVANAAVTTVEGVTVPDWLPFGSGADAASTALLGLMPHYRRTQDAGTRALIARVAEGLVRMQAGDAATFPHGAHLSWRNQWHGWGNAQSYALLRAGALLDRPDFTRSALAGIDGFYPHLLRTGMLSSFALRRDGDRLMAVDVQRFPQIAYGISPMVLAANEAYRVTGDARYRDLARRLAAWFAGDNAAGRPMYDPATGRAFDGIVDAAKVNLNSGAESTVEALLALTALQGTPLP
ncbi:glycoside hydrolase family protein [Sphingomonas sp. RS2018]